MLFSIADSVVFVGSLQDEEGLFLLSVFRKKAFAVVAVLEFGDVAGVGAEVDEDPGSDAAKLGYFTQHDQLVFVDVRLLLLCPALVVRTMVAILGFSAKFAHDDGLLGKNPLHRVGVFRSAGVPADVLVDSDNVERVGEGIVQGGRTAFNVF